MKTQFHVLTIGLILLLVLLSNSVSCGIDDSIQNYSIKHRWTIKTTVAAYKCWDQDFADVVVGDFEQAVNVNRANFRMEANYGINKYIEIGIFAGFQHYVYEYPIGEEEANDTIFSYAILKKSYAPVFGINVNFQLLPLFVAEKSCRWDVYLITRYGGCLLPHKEFNYNNDKRYRQEYGVGTGIAYYFGNRIGVNSEFLLGNFSYFHRYVDSKFSFRFGISCKI